MFWVERAERGIRTYGGPEVGAPEETKERQLRTSRKSLYKSAPEESLRTVTCVKGIERHTKEVSRLVPTVPYVTPTHLSSPATETGVNPFEVLRSGHSQRE